ncbi:MAG: SDR family oxidoreductase [Pseudomonadota bacterium]
MDNTLMNYYQDKKILITGAASGIGEKLAQAFTRFGAHCILWDINFPALEQLQKKLACEHLDIYACDVRDVNSINSNAQLVLTKHSRIDILINNAGIVYGKQFLEITDNDLQKIFAINTLAIFRTVKAFLPAMLQQQSGHIVTIASAAGLIGNAKMTDYSATKFAAFGFDESLRLEFKHGKIPLKTTIICPYYIDTGMFAGVKTRFSWLLPILKEDYAVKKMINAIAKQKKRLIMPRFVNCIFLARILPVTWFDSLMTFFGIPNTMDDFTGRIKNKD